MYDMFVKLQRTQGIIIVIDDRTKICSTTQSKSGQKTQKVDKRPKQNISLKKIYRWLINT